MTEDPHDNQRPTDDLNVDASIPDKRDSTAALRSEQYPDIGYHLVKWARQPLPVDGMTPAADTNELTLSAMSVPQTQTFVEFTIEGSDGHTYTKDDFDAIPDDPDPAECTAVCDRIENTTGKPRRLALVHLTRITDAAPEAASACSVDVSGAARGDATSRSGRSAWLFAGDRSRRRRGGSASSCSCEASPSHRIVPAASRRLSPLSARSRSHRPQPTR